MRAPTMAAKPRKAVLAKIPAPVGGLIANRNLSVPSDGKQPPGAEVLRDMFPTATGAVVRRGSQTWSATGSAHAIGAMWRHVSGSTGKLFAATSDGIWNVTAASPVSSGRTVTSGDWSVVQFSTAGGVFSVGVNGADTGFTYNGTTFSDINLTGVSSVSLSYVFVYKQRLYFVQKSTLDVWYLPVDQIGGTVTKLPLGGVFPQGGQIVFGHAWSGDSSGDGGLSEQVVFVSSEGEVAVYQGLSPDDAATWGKVGSYRIGKPLGKRAFSRAGGDLLVATSVGLISLASASQRDLAALGSVAVSYPIEDRWRAAVRDFGDDDWSCEIWPEGAMLIVAPNFGLAAPVLYVANTNTGAWCEFTGWKALALKTFNGGIYFGTSGGIVKQAWTTGADDGASYVGQYLPLFDDFGAPGQRKVALMARVMWRAGLAGSPSVAAKFDLDTTFPTAPSGGIPASDGIWGAGLWGAAKWASGIVKNIYSKWFSVGGSGDKASVAIQFTSGAIIPYDAEIVEVDLTYQTADIVT